MSALTERLEVRLSTRMVRLLRQEAERRGISVAQLVREAIELLLNEDQQARLRAAEELFQIEAPTADWDQMKREIEAAHRGSEPR